jgi:hypothetical protein
MSNTKYIDELLKDNVRVVAQGQNLASENTHSQGNLLGSKPHTESSNLIDSKLSALLSKRTVMAVGLFTAIAIGAGLVYTNNKDKSITIDTTKISETTNKSFIDTVKSGISPTTDNTIEKIAQSSKTFPLFQTQTGKHNISPSLQKIVEEAVRFDIPENFKENQISRFVSQTKLKSAKQTQSYEDYLLSIMSEAEGFRSNLYRDNIGLAYGIGWNVSMQNSAYNKFLMSAVTNNQKAIDTIVGYSNSPKPFEPNKYGTPDTKLEYQRFAQVSLIMSDTFKKEGVLKGIEKTLRGNSTYKPVISQHKDSYKAAEFVFNQLEPNIQAALTYHAYKVGAGGYQMFKTMNNHVVEHALTPVNQRNKEKLKNIVESAETSYVLDGRKVIDTRHQVLMSAMIHGSETFGAIIKSNPAPKNMYEFIPQLKSTNAEPPKINSNSEWNIPDPIGQAKQTALEQGKPLNMKLDYSSFLPKEPNNMPKAKKHAVPAAWG